MLPQDLALGSPPRLPVVLHQIYKGLVPSAELFYNETVLARLFCSLVMHYFLNSLFSLLVAACLLLNCPKKSFGLPHLGLLLPTASLLFLLLSSALVAILLAGLPSLLFRISLIFLPANASGHSLSLFTRLRRLSYLLLRCFLGFRLLPA